MRAITYEIRTARWLACKLLGRVRPRIYWSGLSGLRLRDLPEVPLPGPDWVRCRPILGGICGSDLGLVRLNTIGDYFGRALLVEPVTLGHENVSEVVEVGPEAAGVAVGTRVNVDPVIACAARGLDPCPSCRAGQFAACENVARDDPRLGFALGYSATVGGSWSDGFVAHPSQIVPVAAGLSDEAAVLVDPISSGVHAALRRMPADGDRDVLVLGGGLLGLAILEFLRAEGFDGRLFATARHAYQKDLALAAGADTVWDGRDLAERDLMHRVADVRGAPLVRAPFGKPLVLGGMDLVYDAVGVRGTVEDALRVVRPQGTVVLVGMGHPRWVDWDPVTHKQIHIVGSHGRGREVWRGREVHTYEVVHALMGEGRFPADRYLTHTFALEAYREAFDTLIRKGATRAVHGAFRL